MPPSSPPTRSAPSGVLAAVTTGIYMGIRGPSIIDARTRLQGFMVWDILDFLLNAALFVLVGLQLRPVVDGLSGYSAGTLARLRAGGERVVVVVSGSSGCSASPTSSVRWTGARASGRAGVGRGPRFVVAWAGMRGAVSLAAALAIPLTTDARRRRSRDAT